MTHPQPPPSSPRRPRPALLALATLALAAACGGAASGSSGVASLGSTTTTAKESSAGSSAGSQSKADAALKYSQCMRSHGVPNFPDPSISGDKATIQIKGSPGSGLDPNSPQFQAAQSACRGLLPNGGQPSPQQRAQAQDAAVHFAQCMRSHGINIPDPQTSTSGGIGIKITPGQGVDPNSPQFQAAQSACQHFLPFNRTGGSTARASGSAGPATAASQ